MALQFPDNMLSRSAQMCASLQRVVDSHRGEGEVRLFVLADTAHNPLCVDEVAAAHVEADALVHYGRSDFSPVATLPSLLVFGRHPVDTAAVCRAVKDCVSENGRRGQRTIVIFDQPYLYATEDVCRGVSADEDASVSVVYARPIATELRPGTNNERNGGGNTDCSCADGREAKSSGTTCSRGSSLGASEASKALFAAATVPQGHACVAGYVWPLAGAGSEDAFVWVGDDTTALAQLQLTLHRSRWTRVDPSSGACVDGDSNSLQQTINSRYFLIDKARDANIVGILVGTLGVAGFRDIIGRVRTLAEGAEKKTYTVLVGKPNPAKLANFPEVMPFHLLPLGAPLPPPVGQGETSHHSCPRMPAGGGVGDGVVAPGDDIRHARVLLSPDHSLRGRDSMGRQRVGGIQAGPRHPSGGVCGGGSDDGEEGGREVRGWWWEEGGREVAM